MQVVGKYVTHFRRRMRTIGNRCDHSRHNAWNVRIHYIFILNVNDSWLPRRTRHGFLFPDIFRKMSRRSNIKIIFLSCPDVCKTTSKIEVYPDVLSFYAILCVGNLSISCNVSWRRKLCWKERQTYYVGEAFSDTLKGWHRDSLILDAVHADVGWCQ